MEDTSPSSTTLPMPLPLSFAIVSEDRTGDHTSEKRPGRSHSSDTVVALNQQDELDTDKENTNVASASTSEKQCRDKIYHELSDTSPHTGHDTFVMINSDAQTLHSSSIDSKTLLETKRAILLTLGKSLLKYGSPCHRVDGTLQHAAKMLHIDATFSIVPDLVFVSLPKENQDSETLTIKAMQGFDTDKLVCISRVMNGLYKGELDPESCLSALQEIMAAPPTFNAVAACLSFSLTGFAAAICMFGGSWIDAGVSGVLGLVVGILFVVAQQFPIYAPVFEVSSCVLVGFFSRLLYQHACFSKVAITPILILLPGYGITMAIMEIAAHQITTGIIRLAYGVVYAFILAYGLHIGSSLSLAIRSDITLEGTCLPPVSPWFYFLLFPIMSVSIGLGYGSTRRQWFSQLCCATIGFCVLFFLGKVITDGQIVGVIAAFAMGLYANFSLKLTGEPPLAPLCVGITLLVPGSTGVRDAFAMLQDPEHAQGLFPMRMITIALGLSVGLYTAAMIVYPTAKRNSLYITL